MIMYSRRQFIAASALTAGGLLLGCSDSTGPYEMPVEPGRRLSSRPMPNTSLARQGLQPLGLGASRDGLIYIPAAAQKGPVPLIVLLHGAGGSADNWFGSYGDRAEAAGMALVAPESRGRTWGLFYGARGYEGADAGDVAFIDQAFASICDRCPIDPSRVYIAGFSDGASYALSVGLTNGDIFKRVIAFSPGVLTGVDRHGTPEVMISHGSQDEVIHVQNGGALITQLLRDNGYDVYYGEFAGGHEVPSQVSDEAFSWLDRTLPE
jgi:predicted esterase